MTATIRIVSGFFKFATCNLVGVVNTTKQVVNFSLVLDLDYSAAVNFILCLQFLLGGVNKVRKARGGDAVNALQNNVLSDELILSCLWWGTSVYLFYFIAFLNFLCNFLDSHSHLLFLSLSFSLLFSFFCEFILITIFYRFLCFPISLVLWILGLISALHTTHVRDFCLQLRKIAYKRFQFTEKTDLL